MIFRKPIENQKSIEILFSHLKNDFSHYTMKNDFKNIFGLIKECIFLRKTYTNFHITGDCHYVGIFLAGKNVTHTYHDFNYLSTLNGLKYLLYNFIWVTLPVFFSKKIVFISPYTKQVASNYSKIFNNKGIIIFNCVPEFSKKNIKRNPNKKKILAFNTGVQKNISTLISSLKGLNNIELHLIGKPWSSVYSDNIKLYTYSDLSHKELELLYSSCDLLWFASIHEGFGMPIIEAQQIEIPVITSNNSSLKWVSGNGAFFISNPKDIEENKLAITKVLYNYEIREKLINEGKANLKRFSISKFKKDYHNFLNDF